ncbi:hypothetical protein IFM89_024761 [Coptis chinensis]|uniref:Uncharacterized protein n=1 Tax=Coptis chinensis TaxID=261450 RepID=A0A835GXU7_9MAGN|nr:hypothetical protein IFM89_024761 [Coptis chinensis]
MSRFNVQGFPTILVFGADIDSPFPYESSARAALAIESFALGQLETNVSPPEVTELTSPLLREKEEGRNKYVQLLLSVAVLQISSREVLIAASKQPVIEKQVGVGGYGYLAMVALNVKKGAQAPLRGAFELDQIIEFVKEAGRGGKGNLHLESPPTIVKTEPWDGNDGEIIEKDEFSIP